MKYFKGKQFKKDMILVAVGYYGRFFWGYRDVSEILNERGVSVHPTTIIVGFMNTVPFFIRSGKRKIKQSNRKDFRTLKGLETVHALYKQKRSRQPDSVFSVCCQLRKNVPFQNTPFRTFKTLQPYPFSLEEKTLGCAKGEGRNPSHIPNC